MDNRDRTWHATSLSLLLGKRRVIDDVSVRLCGGEMTALIGPNGAGKSTLLRLLTGFLSPNSGERHVEGRALEHWSSEALSRRRAVMLQRTQLHADWPVETVIAMGRSPWGKNPDRQMIQQVMVETGCDHLAGRRYPSLSGGEQQRVGIARAVVNKPAVLLADEPTGNLDEALSEGILRLFEEFNRVGVTVLMATHDLGLISSRSYRMLTLSDGHMHGGHWGE